MGAKTHAVYWLTGVLVWTLAVVVVAAWPALGQGDDTEGDEATTEFSTCSEDGNWCEYRIAWNAGTDFPSIGLWARGTTGEATPNGTRIHSGSGITYSCGLSQSGKSYCQTSDGLEEKDRVYFYGIWNHGFGSGNDLSVVLYNTATDSRSSGSVCSKGKHTDGWDFTEEQTNNQGRGYVDFKGDDYSQDWGVSTDATESAEWRVYLVNGNSNDNQNFFHEFIINQDSEHTNSFYCDREVDLDFNFAGDPNPPTPTPTHTPTNTPVPNTPTPTHTPTHTPRP